MTEKQRKTLSMTSNIIGIVLCVILVPILLANIVLITKSLVRPNDVPDIFGYKPFIVLSPSMQKPENSATPYDNHINKGDLIFVKTVNPDTLKVGDIITFRENNTTTTTTHRIIEIVDTDNGVQFRTKGDNNNSSDGNLVNKASVEGVYVSRVAGLGNFAMFMQTPTGIIVFITVPLALFFVSYMLKNKGKQKQNTNGNFSDEQQKLLKEKEELQKQLQLMKEKEELQKQLDSLKSQATDSTEQKSTDENDSTKN